MMGYITEAKKPTIGKAISAVCPLPNKRSTQTEDGQYRKEDQHPPAVHEFHQQESEYTAGGHQSPKISHCFGACFLCVITMIGGQKLGDPVGNPLFGADITDHGNKKKNDHSFFKQLYIDPECSGLFFCFQFHFRKTGNQKNPDHAQADDGKQPVHGYPGQICRDGS